MLPPAYTFAAFAVRARIVGLHVAVEGPEADDPRHGLLRYHKTGIRQSDAYQVSIGHVKQQPLLLYSPVTVSWAETPAGGQTPSAAYVAGHLLNVISHLLDR